MQYDNETELPLTEFSFEQRFNDMDAVQWMQQNW